ncbi:hypothetical protein ACQP2U_43515 (plasmid) [Nocardia sp. CA-084685]|uniref:hypothetical protein n=1 Tax=Nocardia sp. CA-084685 TaxID=3239970 RepID=UPI003D97DCE1
MPHSSSPPHPGSEEPAPASFRAWTHELSVDDQGEYGLIPAIDGTRDDGRNFHVHAYEDGHGGLVLSLYADPDVAVEVVVDSDSAPIDIDLPALRAARSGQRPPQHQPTRAVESPTPATYPGSDATVTTPTP